MELLLIEPKTGKERYWPVESREDLAEVFKRTPEAAEWCRKDGDNRDALLDVVRQVEGGGNVLADGLARLFNECGVVGAEAFAGAVRKVLAEGSGMAVAMAEEWKREREAKEEEERRRREEAERLLKTPGRVMTLTLPGGAAMEMVWCPAGEFWMGSPDNEKGRWSDETLHRVTLTKGFWMAKYPVTQAQWKSVMGSNPSDFKGDDLPVESVRWNACVEFCRKAGLQLPTEAQWEYACRAGSRGPYAGTGILDEMGWYDGNSGHTTHPVGQKTPNAWGLYDMHGNVSEWCADWYGDYPNHAVTDPQGASSGSSRVRRGGSWYYGAANCRSAGRSHDSPSATIYNLGFRPSRILP